MRYSASAVLGVVEEAEIFWRWVQLVVVLLLGPGMMTPPRWERGGSRSFCLPCLDG